MDMRLVRAIVLGRTRLITELKLDLSFRFLAPKIADAIYNNYFDGIKMQGMQEPRFLRCINGMMVSLTCEILYYSLRELQTVVYKKLPNFNPEVVGGGRVCIIACFLITESTNHEKRKIIFAARRTSGGGSPMRRRICLY